MQGCFNGRTGRASLHTHEHETCLPVYSSAVNQIDNQQLNLAFQSHPFCTVISVISHGEMTHFAVRYEPYCKPGHSLRSSKHLPRPSQREGARACGPGECCTASASSLTFSTLFVLPSAACLLQGYKILHPLCKFFGKKMKWYMFLSVCCFGIKLAMLIHTVGFI